MKYSNIVNVREYAENKEIVEKIVAIQEKVMKGDKYRRAMTATKEERIAGKLAEFAVYKILKEQGVNCSEPDLNLYGEHETDGGADLTAEGKTIQVKTSANLKSKWLDIMHEEELACDFVVFAVVDTTTWDVALYWRSTKGFLMSCAVAMGHGRYERPESLNGKAICPFIQEKGKHYELQIPPKYMKDKNPKDYLCNSMVGFADAIR